MASGFHRCKSIVLLFLLAATMASRCVDGSRSMKTGSYAWSPPTPAPAMRLFGSLPRPKLIPPSGPSERHNSIGPENEEEPKQKP
ncbi:hypothetical protein ACP70R_010665 [Stipagrostis hirtigluma subsp. patula]